LGIIDFSVVLVYFIAMAAMGVYCSKKNTSTEQYFVGGRSFKGWIVGISLIGAAFSSVTVIAFPADAFKTNWVRFTPHMAILLVVFIASRVILPFFRRGKITSVYEYLGNRFGYPIRLYGSLTFVIIQLMRNSIILYLVSLLVYQITGLDPMICVIVSGFFVAFYTIIGGIDAVIWTDVVQTIVFLAGGILCLVMIVAKLPGGLSQVFSIAMTDHKFAFDVIQNDAIQSASWKLSLSEKTITMMFIFGVFGYLTEYCGNQIIVQRYCTSSSTKEARKAMWICAFSSLPIWAFYMFTGTSLYAFFKVFPVPEATEMLTGTRPAEQVLPFFITNYLPTGVKGIVIAAALAAAMSTLSASINSISTVCVVDIYKKYFAKNKSDKHCLKVAWLIALLTGLLLIVGALILFKTKSNTLQDTYNILISLISGGLLGIFLFGFFTTKGDSRAVGLGIVCTLMFTAWATLSVYGWLPDFLKVPFDTYYTMIIGNIIMFSVGYVAGCLLPRKHRDLTNLTVWTQDGKPIDSICSADISNGRFCKLNSE